MFLRKAIIACAVSVLGSSAWASLGSQSIDMLPDRAEVGSVIAITRDLNLGDAAYEAASEFVVGEEGELFAVSPDDEDPIDTGMTLNQIPASAYMVIPVDIHTAELSTFNIAADFEVAGRGGHRRGRGGVTNCYHVAKAILSRKIHLSGVAAYMAAPQLEHAGWRRYSYSDAPNGAACVFGAGGKHTSSGGARYGHIGIKGRGGVVSPEAGFRLGRPFLGCWAAA